MNAGTAYTLQWVYNSADLPIILYYPDWEGITYGYNNQMLLQSVIGSNTYVSSTVYDGVGRITSRVLGNGLTQTNTYYAWDEKVGAPQIGQGGRLKKITAGSLQNVTYTYDAAGNISTILDSNAGPQTQSFTYDVLNRLSTATATGGLNGLYNETYSYDSTTGNLAHNGSVNLSYNYTSHPHAVSDAGSNHYTYGPNGNMACRRENGTTYKQDYNFENQLISVQTTTNNDCTGTATTVGSFVYDGDGKRVKATVNGTTTTFVGSYYEITNTGAVTKYYFAGTQRVAMRKYTIPQPMNLEYFLGDHLGSTSITTDSSGAKVSEIRYKPWGEIRYAWTSGQTTTPAYKLSNYTFTGQYSYMDDPTTTGTSEGIGLMFYNARFYSPYINHFIQPDTIIPGQANPQSWDRYTYVNNNPLRYVDPTGHMLADDDDGGDYDPNYCASHPTICGSGGGNDQGDDWDPEITVPDGNGLSTVPGSCGTGGLVNCPPVATTTYPNTLTYHPLDSNVVSIIPIYDYSQHPPRIIGYKETYYKADDIHFSWADFIFPSDPITFASQAQSIASKLVQMGVKNLGKLAPEVTICPECTAVLTVISGVDSANSATTIHGHLVTVDVYFQGPPTEFSTPLDNPIP